MRRFLIVFVTACVSCGVSAESAKYPPRPEGCEVKIFADTPSVPTDNIGPITASCDSDVSDALCTRTLQDEACKLGADVVWGVADTAPVRNGKKRLAGRAAHTRASGHGGT